MNTRPRAFSRWALILTLSASFFVVLIMASTYHAQAATRSKTNSTDGIADGSTLVREVTFAPSDFTNGASIVDLGISIDFEKVDTGCGVYTGNNVFNREIFMVLSSPQGTDVVLVEDVLNSGGSGASSTYSSNSVYNGQVTVTFDDQTAQLVGGSAPTNGTFRPIEPLSAFNGEDPVGTWSLKLGDSGAGEPLCFYEYTLTIDADQPPVGESKTVSLAENSPNNTAVTTVSATDGDPGEKFTFTEIGGTGAAIFEIDSNSGVISVTDSTQLDYETPPTTFTYIVEIADSAALTDTATITINVTDANDKPTNLALTPGSVTEHQPSGTSVGAFSTTDQDTGDSHTYALVSGTGDDDNNLFTIVGTALQTAVELDYDVAPTRTVRVQTNDGQGGTFAKALVITIVDGNDPPTDISLSSNTVAENQASGTSVGTLSATDPNADSPITFTLVSGTGDDDNSQFTIVGTDLQTAVSFDYETQITHTIRVQANDGNGGTYQESLTILVTDANDPPTDLTLSKATIAENQPTGTAVGTLSTTDPDSSSFTYSLVSGAGDDNNGQFTIVGNELQSDAIFDADPAPVTYTVRIQTNDGDNNYAEAFVITVTDANDAPTDIALSNSTVLEHQASGTTVGTLSATDQDSGDTHTYALVSGTGDDDNGKFEITGSTLKTAVELDYDTQINHTVRIQVSDGNGGTFTKQFSITVTDGNDPPTDISLDSTSIDENQPSSTLVGNLSATDPNADSPITFSLTSGVGGADNGSFTVSGTQLLSNTSFDRETKVTYNIRLKANDGNGGTYEEAFTISIGDANDAPTAVSLSPATIAENQPISTTVGTLSATDQDSGDTHTFTLVSGTGDTDNGRFAIVGGQIKTLQTFDYETDAKSYSIRVQADDANSGLFAQAIIISLTDGNDDPTDISLSSLTIAENEAVGTEVGSFSTTDPDSVDSHSYSLVPGTGDTDNNDFTIIDEYLETAVVLDYESQASHTIRVQTEDSGGRTFEKVFIITVTDANDAPVANPDSGGTIDEDQSLTVLAGAGVLLNDTDEDSGDTKTVSGYDVVSSKGAQVTVTSDGGFTYDPSTSTAAQALAASESLVDSFTYTVEDSGGLSDSATVTVTVTGVNDAPTAVTDNQFTPQDSPVEVNVLSNDTDPEGDTMSVVSVTQPAHGTAVVGSGGIVTYTPDDSYIGMDSFTYTVADQHGASAVGTVSIEVGQTEIFIPFAPGGYAPAPDLIVTNVEASNTTVSVTIENQGNIATSSGFWVDFYVDPSPAPTEEDQVWQQVAAEGIVWGVNESVGVGQSLTLTFSTAPGATNQYYSAVNSLFSGTMAVGTPVYAHVDSSHANTIYGGVLENHEIGGTPYNNISGPYFSE